MDPYSGRPVAKQTSPWAYVGLGCGLIVLFALIAIVGFTYLAYRQGKEMVSGFKDPKSREAKTRQVLPYTTLPAGYYPGGAMSIPFLMDFAVLTDQEPTAGQGPDQGNFRDHSFIFMNMRHLRDNKEKMERYLRGEAAAPSDTGLNQSNVNFHTREVVKRGQLALGGKTVLYQASRGDISHKGNTHEAVVTMVLPECGDDRLRFGVWISPAPADSAAKPLNQVDFTGTAADPAALQEFLGHFRLCDGQG
jgi:hypothetical protein